MDVKVHIMCNDIHCSSSGYIPVVVVVAISSGGACACCVVSCCVAAVLSVELVLGSILQ
jgi:hypothetical protein